MNKIDGKTIYQIKDYITNIPTPTFIPTLDTNATINEETINTFRKTFFPKPSPTDLKDIRRAKYPEKISYEHQITIRQIRSAVEKLAPEKAPEPNEIANMIIKKHSLSLNNTYEHECKQASTSDTFLNLSNKQTR